MATPCRNWNRDNPRLSPMGNGAGENGAERANGVSENKTSDGGHRFNKKIPMTERDIDTQLDETRAGARRYGRRNDHNRMKRDALRDDRTRRPTRRKKVKTHNEPTDGTMDEPTGETPPPRYDKPGRRTTPPPGNERHGKTRQHEKTS